MLLPPVATSVFGFLNTPDYLCLRNTSRTMRCFVESNPRFFRSLTLVRRGAEYLFETLEHYYENTDNFAYQLREMAAAMAEQMAREQMAGRRIEQNAIATIIDSVRCLGECGPLQRWLDEAQHIHAQLLEYEEKWPAVKRFRIQDFYCPQLMGRHLAQIINSVPVGRVVSSVVLDGTGVDTRWIQLILIRFRSTLRGLSVRDCKNINVHVFADWLGESLLHHHPIALKWLRVYLTLPCIHLPSTYNI